MPVKFVELLSTTCGLMFSRFILNFISLISSGMQLESIEGIVIASKT